MKVILVVAGLIAFLAVIVLACPKGTEPYKDTCVVEIKPQTGESVKPSDEKPPSDKMPSYQREGIEVINEVNLSTADADADKARADADAEGKRAAGIPALEVGNARNMDQRRRP